MKDSFEKNLESKFASGEKEERLKIPMLKYFWQASPLAVNRGSSIHQFLKQISMFKNFSDFEIWTLTKYMHMRKFSPREIVFKEGDSGLGFYVIFEGRIEIYSKRAEDIEDSEKVSRVADLHKYDYLGELSIIDSSRARNATAVASEATSLLAIYKPDLDELIENHPIVAAKFLQSVAIIISNRFYAVTNDLKLLKEKLERLEKTNVTTSGE